jgi:hypothetical protein
MHNRHLAMHARSVLLRRGRAILRLREDCGGEPAAGDGPDYLGGLTDAERRDLVEVHEALDRIDSGTWGRCDGCADPIGRDRLEAAPWERRCAPCAIATRRAA